MLESNQLPYRSAVSVCKQLRLRSRGQKPACLTHGRGESYVPSDFMKALLATLFTLALLTSRTHADEALPFALEIGADELPGGPLEHLKDFAGRAEVGPVRLARNPHENVIV